MSKIIMMNNIAEQMTYNQLLSLVAPLLGGLIVGIIFFAGLWWSIQRSTHSTHPALLFGSSFLLRSSISIIAIYLLSDDQWPKLLVCLLGFIFARILMITIIGVAAKKKEEASHAP